MLRTVAQALRRGPAQAVAARAFAAQASSTAPAISWEDVNKAVLTDHGKRELQSLRSTFNDVNNKLKALAEPAPELDWDEVEASVDPAVIAAYRKAISEVEWPSYPGTELAEAQAEFATLQTEAERLRGVAEVEIERLSAELSELEELKTKIRTLTADEYLAKHPEIAAEVDAEAERRYYMPW